MNSRKILFNLFVPAALMLLVTQCSDDEAITYSVKDVSSRITGFSHAKTGPGAELTINGSQLGKAERVFIGTQMVGKRDFINHTESSISFVVPTSATPNTNGEKTKVMVVFGGPERAFKEIEVVPFQAITGFSPKTASVGETVTLFGVNFDLVTSVRLGGNVDATITSKNATVLKFTMPSGASTGRITLVGEAGDSKSSGDLIACESDPNSSIGCRTDLINTNGSFENTPVGVLGAADGWGGLNSGGRITAEITDETSYRGSKCVKITVNSIGGNPWDIQPTSNMPVESNAKYRLSVWVKGSGLAKVKFAIDEGGSPGYAEFAAPEVAINSNEWTEITYDFEPASEAAPGDGVARFAISMSYEGNVGGVMYMDDLRVVKIE